MAKLFNKQILKRYLQKHSIPAEQEKIQRIARWKRNLKMNRNVKEEALQAAFLKGIFGSILGYSDLTEAEDKQYTMKVEPATEVDATRPDGSLGFFEINGTEQTKVVIELKGPKISLDEKQKRAGKDYGTAVEQAFGYATKYDGIEWVIVSNMIEIRLYKYDRGQGHYEEFLIPRLDDPANFKEFHLILSLPNLINRENGSLTEKLTRETSELEEDITTEFYNLYKQTRIELFEHLKQHNPDYDQELLFEKAQKFLDRIIFICFCEDLGLLPSKILHKAIQGGKASFSMSDTRIWEEIKGIFKAIDQGNPAKNINAYNGGLFKPDETLHQLTIKNDFFTAIDDISAYDFDSDLDVNILGHIFEQSISDIEEIKADIQAEEYNQQESKRKKEGIFYTPEYITKYIVENSVGKYIEDIKTELGYAELPEIEAAESPQVEGKYRQKHLRFYDEYIQRLRSIKILDPACGSGAFLNQAFDYLLLEYKWVRNQRSLIEKKPIDISLQDQVFKQILQDNLYGVDLNQESVEITKLSLWLKSANKNKPLANLDDNIKCGNSLIDDPEVAGDKAFDWEAEFPEIMDAGGFDVVIGNPPYVRQEEIKWMKNYLSESYQVYMGRSDLFTYFFEKAIKLLSKNGYLGFISSSKFLEAKYGKQLLQFLVNNSRILKVIDFKDLNVFSKITSYPIIIILKRNIKKNYEIQYSTVNKLDFSDLYSKLSKTKSNNISIDNFIKNGFKFLSKKESEIINKTTTNSISINEFCKLPVTGIKTGFNKGYTTNKKNSQYIKPYAFGKNIKRYKPVKPETNIIFPYKLNNKKYELININNFEGIKKLLKPFKNKLKNRAIIKSGLKNGNKTWYQFQQINKNINFNKEYIVYPNVSLGNNFTISSGNIIDMTGFILPTNNRYILALLNSKLISFLMQIWAISRRGGYLEYKTQYIKKIPIKGINQNEQKPFIQKTNFMLKANNILVKKQNTNIIKLIYKYTSNTGPTISTVTEKSQFYNQIYTGRARKVRPLTVNINDNILTVYAEKSSSGLYELFKFQVDDKYQRQYIKLYLENLTDEQLEEIDTFSGNLPEKILQIEIPDYNKPNVVQKVVDEWQDLQDEIQSLENTIEQTDREIDEMVYELYGLTDEEIAIVEESV